MYLFPILLLMLSGGSPAQTAERTVLLRNGAVIQNEGKRPYKYWSCSDTYLSEDQVNANYGAEPVLEAGPGRRPLVRFDDLHRAIGPGKRIVDAKLILTLASAQAPRDIGVYRVLQDWREGAGRVQGKNGTKSPWSATWDYRMSDASVTGMRWRGGGCFQADVDRTDRPTGWYRVPNEDTGTYEITGLGPDVRQWYDKRYTNFGWVLEVRDEGVQFNSSEASAGRPALEITYVDAPVPANEADLGVSFIERTPEFFRYDPTGDAYTRKDQAGTPIGIMDKPGLAREQKWPRANTLVTYRAHVRNYGTARPVESFTYRWWINGTQVRQGEHEGALRPGEEIVLEAPAIWIDDHSDHRIRTVEVEVETSTPETTKNNNRLAIYSHALDLGIHVEQSLYDYFKTKPNALGSYSFEDWVQWQFWMWNEVWLAKSKFSFAPDGCLERVRIQRINIVPDGTLQGGNHVPNGVSEFHYDGEWGFDWPTGRDADMRRYVDENRDQCETGLLHECSHQIGLIDLYVMNIDSSMPNGERGKVRLKAGRDTVVTRGCIDPFGGLMGGGDTRNDTMVGPFLTILNEPQVDPLWRFPLFEPTGLYSASSVAGLNSTLGYRRGYYGEYLYTLPKLIFLRALDASGRPMPGAELAFFQENAGEFKDEPPVFEGKTDDRGVFRLPNRPTGESKPFTTRTGHTLAPNPFGRIDVVGSNGAFLVRARYAGQEEWQFLKIWELNTAYARGVESVLIWDMRFQISPVALRPENLALGKTVNTSAGGDGGAALTDGDWKTVFPVAGETGEWLTIDLGAEYPVAEVTLHAYGRQGDFWPQFEIVAYGGEEEPGPLTARLAREADWRWTVQHRRDVDPADAEHWSVTYRNAPVNARYVRIVNVGEGGGQLAEVKVRAGEQSQSQPAPQPQ
jgi:hypothetical protein